MPVSENRLIKEQKKKKSPQGQGPFPPVARAPQASKKAPPRLVSRISGSGHNQIG
jgi:hypothetical protein